MYFVKQEMFTNFSAQIFTNRISPTAINNFSNRIKSRMKRHIIIALVFTLHTLATQANTAPGYIITNNSDTIAGEIKVSRFLIFIQEGYYAQELI